MNWMIQHKNLVRIGLFALLLVAILGPWAYDHDGVPWTAELCHPPYLLLENGHCVGRISGFFLISFFLTASVSLISQLLTGEVELVSRWREFLILLIPLFMLILPAISILLRVAFQPDHSQKGFHLSVWGLAAALALLIALTAEVLHPDYLWGIWLYALLALMVLALEMVTARVESGLEGRREA